MSGRFITFEGIDGAGKSSHVEWLAEWLRSRGLVVQVTREPGGTALGEKLREMLLNDSMHLETETLLMFAAGIQTPLSVAGAVNCRPDIAGTAAGLSSSMALVLSGSFSIMAGFLYVGDFLPVAALIAVSSAMAGVTYWLTR